MEANNKLRDTLDFADKELRRATEDPRYGEDLVYLVGCMRTVANACRAALAEPPRNCDVGTAEEQNKRLCSDFFSVRQCGSFTRTALEWGQMPYEEGGAK